MTSAACDIDYSVERFFATRWTTTEIAYPRQPFDSEAPGLLRWIAFETLLVSGRPSRAADYQADVLITVNCFSRDGKRDLMRLAQQVEELLLSIPYVDDALCCCESQLHAYMFGRHS